MRRLVLAATIALGWHTTHAEQIILGQKQQPQLQFNSIETYSASDFSIGVSSLPKEGYSLAYHRPFAVTAIPPAKEYDLANVVLKSRPVKVWRPLGGRQAYQDARIGVMRAKRGQPQATDYTPLEWKLEQVEGPDVGDMNTLAGLAKMASNAYLSSDKAHKGNKEWYDDSKWNISDSFGWTEDGIRGHVFATADNSSVVVAIKGTSAGALIGGGGSTQVNDKTNDNLLFSCCCARVDWSWSTVCDCYSGGWKCDENCLEDALVEKSVYYPLATDLYNNITLLYPNANIWLTGHSLGGSLASLLSLTFGVPCVTFEAVADRLAAKRLHLPMPPTGEFPETITHVYHTADPIPQGACTGSLSSCSIAGFALESRCHSGQTIVFDTVSELGWGVDIRTHGIVSIIDRILKDDWDVKSLLPERESWSIAGLWGGKKKAPVNNRRAENRTESNVPLPTVESDCLDCFRWEYGDFKK